MGKIRTVRQALREIRENDPKTMISERFIRSLIASNQIKYIKYKNRYLLNVEDIQMYLAGAATQPITQNKETI